MKNLERSAKVGCIEMANRDEKWKRSTRKRFVVPFPTNRLKIENKNSTQHTHKAFTALLIWSLERFQSWEHSQWTWTPNYSKGWLCTRTWHRLFRSWTVNTGIAFFSFLISPPFTRLCGTCLTFSVRAEIIFLFQWAKWATGDGGGIHLDKGESTGKVADKWKLLFSVECNYTFYWKRELKIQRFRGLGAGPQRPFNCMWRKSGKSMTANVWAKDSYFVLVHIEMRLQSHCALVGDINGTLGSREWNWDRPLMLQILFIIIDQIFVENSKRNFCCALRTFGWGARYSICPILRCSLIQ